MSVRSRTARTFNGGKRGKCADTCPLIANAELYDASTGTFINIGALPPTFYPTAGAALPDGGVLVIGFDRATQAAAAELYDPVGGTFSPTGALPDNRNYETVTPLRDGRILVTGGDVGLRSADGKDTDLGDTVFAAAELYDPTTGKWSATGSIVRPRSGAVATMLVDGRVLIVGGMAQYTRRGQSYQGGEHILSAEIYNPKTGQFSATGSMARDRGAYSDFTATTLLDGRVLVAGGDDSNCDSPLHSAELFDPKAGRFSATKSLITGRSYQTATLLADGRVLLAGGYQVCANAVSLWSAELYQP